MKRMDDGEVVPWWISTASTFCPATIWYASRPSNSIHCVFVVVSTTMDAREEYVGVVAARFQRAISYPLRYTTPPSLAINHSHSDGHAQLCRLGAVPLKLKLVRR